ncbi:MAG: hypothetical protein ABI380_12930, partial [Edaphobacter sp.]
MPRLPIRILLCLSSYSPLLALIGLQALRVNKQVGAWFIAASLISVIVLWVFFWANSSRQREPLTLKVVQQRDSDVMGYVVTYLVPFVNSSYRSPDGSFDALSVIAISVLFLVILIIYVNANLIYINPILALLGYRIYEVELADSSDRKALLTRRTMVPL